MSVYVDELGAWGWIMYGRKVKSCHMIADTEAELHAMADAIKLARVHFQAPPEHMHPHYDLVTSKRGLAIAAGAVVLAPLPWGEKLREIRSAMKAGTW